MSAGSRTPEQDAAPTLNRAELLRLRADFLSSLRAFFLDRGVLEVETPLRYPTTSSEPHLASVTAGAGRYLQTSPEFPMKRLLAEGCGPVFQVCKAFREGERGRLHNPEFTMLEWYRPGFDTRALATELADLVGALVPGYGAPEYRDYRELFRSCTGLDPWQATDSELAACAAERLDFRDATDRAGLLDLVFGGVVEPELDPGRLVIVTGFPPQLAELAALRPAPEGIEVADRFEAFLGGMELANGCLELLDGGAVRSRWESNNRQRVSAGLPEVPVDEALLAVIDDVPACSGAALGVDRLIMVATGAATIGDVIAFPDPVIGAF